MIKDINAITPEYFKYRLEQETEQYKQEIERLNRTNNEIFKANETLAEEIKKLQKQLQQKKNKEKEIREYINWRLEEDQDMYKYQMEELLEILDKID